MTQQCGPLIDPKTLNPKCGPLIDPTTHANIIYIHTYTYILYLAQRSAFMVGLLHICIYIYMATTPANAYIFPTQNALPPVAGLKKGPFLGTQFRVPKLAFFGCLVCLKTSLPLVIASNLYKMGSKTLFLERFRAIASLQYNQKARNVNNVNSSL